MILFITRKFPPTKGGMETAAHELYRHLSQLTDVKLIKWNVSSKLLFLVLPYFLLKSCCMLLLKKKVRVIYLQDGLLSPLGVVLKNIFNKPVSITIHGLDITYKNSFYQFLIPRCVGKLDEIICVSTATREQCLKRRIPQNKIIVIPNGISEEFYIKQDIQKLKDKLSEKLKLNLKDKKIILSVGRIVERKGFHWFIENVLPKIIDKEKDAIYLIAGDGPLKERIRNSIMNSDMKRYAVLLGKVDDETLKLLYNSSDVMVIPNIPVKGDMEGFGIVALEATSCGLPVVASNIEGIKDAIVKGKNGFLVEACSAERFSNILLSMLEDTRRAREIGEKARKFTLENFAWRKIAGAYFKTLNRIVMP